MVKCMFGIWLIEDAFTSLLTRVVSRVPLFLYHQTMNILLVGKDEYYFSHSTFVKIHVSTYRCGSGVVNVYDGSCLRTTQRPTLLKSLKHLTTVADQTLFNPTSEMLAISSKRKKAALRLVRTRTYIWNVLPHVCTCNMPCRVLCKHVCGICN